MLRQLPIPGFPGYEVTEDGRVWSAPRKGRPVGKWLRPVLGNNGRYKASLCRKSRAVERTIHRLVLETFIGPCPEGMEACHNNGDPADNRVENLRWDTKSANAMDAVEHGTAPGFCNRGEGNANAKVSNTDVCWMRYLKRAGLSRRDLSELFGVGVSRVSEIVSGRAWGHIAEEVL